MTNKNRKVWKVISRNHFPENKHNLSLVLVAVSCIVYAVRRTRKFAEVLEDGELDYGPHWFKYKDLYISTRGFRDKELLGGGRFGRVYKGVLPTSKIEIAVKRVSHESRQGTRDFWRKLSALATFFTGT